MLHWISPRLYLVKDIRFGLHVATGFRVRIWYSSWSMVEVKMVMMIVMINTMMVMLIVIVMMMKVMTVMTVMMMMIMMI